MNILNIHGFLGEPDNRNWGVLVKLYGETQVDSPSIDYVRFTPKEILEQLMEPAGRADVIVGQSLGGWYANLLSVKLVKPCILTNPALNPAKELLPLIQDSPKEKRPLDESLAQYEQLSGSVNPNAWILCSDGDDVLPGNYEHCRQSQPFVELVSGDHSVIEGREDYFVKIFSEIKDKELKEDIEFEKDKELK